MACFAVPVAEAVVTTIVTKLIEKKEASCKDAENKVPFSRKLRWLNNLLWGGSALLAFEHVWHGEVVPWFPFLTAAEPPLDDFAFFGADGTAGDFFCASEETRTRSFSGFSELNFFEAAFLAAVLRTGAGFSGFGFTGESSEMNGKSPGSFAVSIFTSR